MKNAIELITAERERQVCAEGFTLAQDNNYRSGELCDAAICYAVAAAKQARGESWNYLALMHRAGEVPWPWEDRWWKPSEDQIRNLVKAGALIVAEIERLQRQQRRDEGA